jgi:hypothetical protein
LARDLSQVFRREKEQSVEPVTKEDMASTIRGDNLVRPKTKRIPIQARRHIVENMVQRGTNAALLKASVPFQKHRDVER